jgi:hypothetical protein
VFYLNSNNSSSWTFLGTGFGWFFTEAALISKIRSQRNFALIGFLVCLCLTLGSRSEAIAFLALQVTFVGLLHAELIMKKLKKVWLIALGCASIALLALVLSRSSSFGVLSSGFAYVFDDTPLQRHGFSVFIYNLQAISDLYVGLIGGIRGIGASDTELFGFIQLAMTSACAFIVLTALRGSSRRIKLLFSIWIAICVFVPLWLLQISNLIVGEELAPRYIYPLFVFGVALSLSQREQRCSFSRNQMLVISIAISFANSIVLRQVLGRHIYGIEQYGVVNLGKNKEWWWTFSPFLSPMTVWIAGSISFFLITTYVGRQLSGSHTASRKNPTCC